MDATELLEEIKEMKKEDAEQDFFNQRVAIYVSVLAVLLALTNLGGSNATKDTLINAIAANDTYAFYQAKKIRQTTYIVAADELELLSGGGVMPVETKEKIATLRDKYRKAAARLESEPDKGEGLKELMAKAKVFEELRDHSLSQDPYFDLAEAGLQIAVILASVAMVADSVMLLWLSGGLAVAGTLLMINGFFLLVTIF